jgi:micrococcal nuclease
MRAILFVLVAWISPAFAGERCIAIDGDTLVCNRQKVRLTNVYAAELNEPGGSVAKRRMQSVIASGEVTMRTFGQDRYGRTLAEVYVNGRRIEQGDIGPRAGRGSQWHGERHVWLWSANARPKKPPLH